MPRIVSDMIDAYVVRRVHARVQFLLLQRRSDAALGATWQGVHEHIQHGETALAAAERAVLAATGLPIAHAYSADFINQVYDHTRDMIVLAPVFAFTAPARSPVALGEDFIDYAWCEREEATSRLLLSGQRWAVRQIDELIGLGGPDAELYRLH